MKKEIRLVNKIKRLLRRLKCPRWLHHFGPKKYEFWQHIVALLLKECFKLSFRRASKLLNMLGIDVPTYSALCKIRKRIPLSLWKMLLQSTVNFNSELVAVDATGLSTTNPSWYYARRIGQEDRARGYVKLSAFFDTKRKKFLALRIRAKPRHDIMDVKCLLKQRSNMHKLLGDKAYDADWLHEYCYENNIETHIPLRNKGKARHNNYLRFRRKAAKTFRMRTYHRRSMIEAGFGGLKKRYGSHVLANTISARRAEIYCRAFAYNLRLKNSEIFN